MAFGGELGERECAVGSMTLREMHGGVLGSTSSDLAPAPQAVRTVVRVKFFVMDERPTRSAVPFSRRSNEHDAAMTARLLSDVV